MKWIYVAECLYRKCAGGTIYLRAQRNGKRALRSTKTKDPVQAKKFLQRWRHEEWTGRYGGILPGLQVQERLLTVRDLIDDYVQAGHPTKKMARKASDTIKKEVKLLQPLTEWWGPKNPTALTLADCDAYRDWRNAGGFVTRFKLRGHEHERVTRGGNRIVDMELDCLSNVFHLARRRNKIRNHPLIGRGKYTSAQDIRHCREVAPDPKSLTALERHFRTTDADDFADWVMFTALSGLRIGETLQRRWPEVNWSEGIIDAKRKKRGIFPWVIISPELKVLLTDMRRRREASGIKSDLLFPSPFDPDMPCDASAIRARLTDACRKLGIRHVTPHGLRSFFVTSARESGLTDAEIAMLIGDKSGPALIASTYGDVRAEHLVRQGQRIRFHHETAPVEP